MMDRTSPDQQLPTVNGPRAAHHRPSPPGHALTTSALPRSRSDESWIEVSSQPSSSSLSSAADEIITTGLRVQHDSNARRRRRIRRSMTEHTRAAQRMASAGGSSQEEYEESESDSDKVMTSSNEALQHSGLQHEWRPMDRPFTLSSASSDNAYISEREDDDDENATAVGAPRGELSFTPQPNAFTHPPQTARAQQQSMNSYFTQRPSRQSSQRHSYPSREQHSPYNIISPSHQVDHDAALRASLSTLLSCAAAARGLPKPNKATETRSRPGPSNRIDATSIGIVPESAVFGESQPKSTETSPPILRAGTAGASTAVEKSKRKAGAANAAATQRSSSKDRRVVKKARRTSSNWTPATMDDVSPTLMTWVVSAGVVVLVSAISFSAGYVTGREAGRAEVLGELGAGVTEAGRCGRDAMVEGAGRGLRRLRWTDAASSIRV